MTFWSVLRAFCVAVFLSLPIASFAQNTTLDYDAWQSVAQRAENAVENGRASSSALETLRSQIADWREQFLDAQQTNQARITTLESQVAALGTPVEGVDEASDIAARRVELDEQLLRLRTPIVAAEEAYNRADGVIKEIDNLIRERQTEELLSGGPSPLNPAYWAPAIEDFSKSTFAIGAEISSAFQSDAQRKTLWRDFPEVVILLVIGLVLVLRGRRWSLKIVDVLRRYTNRGSGVWRFIASLLQIVLPLFGLAFLVEGAFETGLIGLRGTLLLDQVTNYGLLFLAFWWVAGQLFPKTDDDAVLPIGQSHRAGARWFIAASALILIAAQVLQVMAIYDDWSDATRAVLGLPLLVLTGIVLFRLGTLLRGATVDQLDDDEGRQYRVRMAKLLGQAAIVVAIVGPIIAALGYGTAAARLMFSSIATLMLFGLLLVVQGFIEDVFAFLTRKSGRDDDSLIPVLLGFLLVIASLPILALIWGARWADITEVWTRFQEGFAIGDSRISPIDFITFAVIFAIGYTATRLLQGAMRTTILPRTKLDAGGRNAIVSGIGYVGIFLAALIAISSAGIDLSSLAIVAGALSVGIGFGLQNIVSNFVSGIILLIERPIAEGDWIEVGGKMGYVRGISVRSTRIETFDRTDVIVPNADLVSGMVTNWTRGKTVGRVIVPVGVAYGTDTRKVEDVLLKIAREHPMVLLNPEPSIVFQGFGADSMDFEIRAILRDVNYVLSVKSDMNHLIAARFAEEGIEIPFAQRDVWIRNPETLAQAGPAGLAAQTADEETRE
ncbi:DUF3772 domain-containing protein [Planktotalea sp.]|uniref:DUF3772 domain-containing protein n=1 Tax=Planktotalea sp. TaxID=2029877 RepID=UPI003D6A65B3